MSFEEVVAVFKIASICCAGLTIGFSGICAIVYDILFHLEYGNSKEEILNSNIKYILSEGITATIVLPLPVGFCFSFILWLLVSLLHILF